MVHCIDLCRRVAVPRVNVGLGPPLGGLGVLPHEKICALLLSSKPKVGKSSTKRSSLPGICCEIL